MIIQGRTVAHYQSRNWQKRRSSFNHDFMKNKYLTALDDWISLLNDRQEDEYLERSFIAKKLPKWEQNRGEALWLSEHFELEMSPRALFNEPPLSASDKSTKEWLGEAIHLFWLERHGIKKLVSGLDSAIKRADEAYASIVKALKGVNTQCAAEMRQFLALFENFRRSCGEVSISIENFPGEVLVL